MTSLSRVPKLPISIAGNVKSYINWCDKHGINWRKAASDVGLPIEQMERDYWLPTKHLMLMAHQLEKDYGYSLGIEIGRITTVSDMSEELGKQIALCSNLNDALRLLISNVNRLGNSVILWTEYKEDTWWLCNRSNYHPSTQGFEQAEWLRTLTMVNLCKQFLGTKWQPKSAKLTSSGKNASKLPPHFHKTDLRFNQTYGAITIELPDSCAPVLHSIDSVDWYHDITLMIGTYSTLPWFTIEWLAEMVGVTKRTLQRHIANNGGHFTTLKEQAREKKAKQLLIDTTLSVQEISWQVGYSDLSNFNRAFRKWTGVTAPAFRLQNKLR